MAAHPRKRPSATPLGALDRELLSTSSSVIGVDEVGRGCLAGPVVAAAVVFDHIPGHELVQDSKTLTELQRERAAGWIRSTCRRWAVVEGWVDIVDRLNILEATRMTMCSAVAAIQTATAVVVVDAVPLDLGELRTISEPRADARYFCVAAASILAKVHRDHIMRSLATRFRHWQWERNKGYPTVAHRRALGLNGTTFLHRTSFTWKPVL